MRNNTNNGPDIDLVDMFVCALESDAVSDRGVRVAQCHIRTSGMSLFVWFMNW